VEFLSLFGILEGIIKGFNLEVKREQWVNPQRLQDYQNANPIKTTLGQKIA
jgi:hypothetical protein